MALRRTRAAINRLEVSRARYDTRDWVVKRRERTRHLIELGGLVQKAGLVELTGDDRAVLYGAFLELAAQLSGENRQVNLALWRRHGQRAFEGDQAPEPLSDDMAYDAADSMVMPAREESL